MKKLFTLLLTLSVVVALFSLNVFASTRSIVDSGSCGADVTYTLYSDGELVISGKGDMANYLSNEPAPWSVDRDGIQKITVEFGVTSIGDHAFSNCINLTSVTISDTVKTIGEYGISNCNSLQSITIPDSVTTIGSNAFFCNQNLVSVTIPDSVTSIGDYAFYLNESLESVTVPSSVTYLGHDVFIHCSGLEKAELSSNLTEIPSGLFCHCTSLKTVTMGNKVEHINSGAFENCPNISNIIYSGTKAQWDEIVIESAGNASLDNAMVITVPEITASSNTAGKPKLTWSAVDGAAKYQIYRSTTGKAGSFVLKTTVTGTSYTNTDATAGTTYYYKVRAVAADGTKGELSAPVTIKCKYPVPTAKGTYVVSSGKPKLTWNAVTDAAKYEIFRSTTGKAGSFVKTYTTTSTSYTNTGAKAGTTYYYKVRAVFKNGVIGNLSSPVTIKCRYPVPTAKGTYVVSSGKPKLTWNAVTDAAKYEIFRSTTGKAGSFVKTYTTTGTSYTNTGAKAGTTYYYKVRAVFKNGVTGNLSSPVTIKCRYPVPTAKAQLSSAGKPKITWNAVTDAKQYQVYRSTTGLDGSFTKAFTTTGTSYTNTGAKAGTKYYYKVRAVFNNGVIGNLSSPVSVTAKK